MTTLLTPSEIIEYLYCPRFTYFMFVLDIQQHEEKRYKVQVGREIHEEKAQINKDYLRKKIGVTAKEQEVYLSNDTLHLKGIVDEVLTLENGTMAPLDYKFAEYSDYMFSTHKYQSLCYALLIEANYGLPVKTGFIVYTRSNNKLIEIEFKDEDRDKLKEIIREMVLIIQKGFFPKKTKSTARCGDCTYRNICV
ncbi:MAG TPA: CRISPR-associated protein Cas4 [bacterium]|nr:CRISPR-associated protein Cas4 [bacterium]HOG43185.1 CRISPR-associated protein Cas4 [bacterium]HQB08744.1 CRISPR-associated protein Cas4 [bacterium]